MIVAVLFFISIWSGWPDFEQSRREGIKDKTHRLQDEEQEELNDEEEEAKTMEEVKGAQWEEGYSNNRTNISFNLSSKKCIVMLACLNLLSSFCKSNSKSSWHITSQWNTKASHC